MFTYYSLFIPVYLFLGPYDVYYDSHKMKTHINGYPPDKPPPYNGYNQEEYNNHKNLGNNM